MKYLDSFFYWIDRAIMSKPIYAVWFFFFGILIMDIFGVPRFVQGLWFVVVFSTYIFQLFTMKNPAREVKTHGGI